MHANHQDIFSRTKNFALTILRLCDDLPRNLGCEIIGKQVIRSATSVGAHVREGKHSRSAAEKLSKISVAAQELEETRYWLELLNELNYSSKNIPQELFQETDELMAILFTSMRTLKIQTR